MTSMDAIEIADCQGNRCVFGYRCFAPNVHGSMVKIGNFSSFGVARSSLLSIFYRLISNENLLYSVCNLTIRMIH